MNQQKIDIIRRYSSFVKENLHAKPTDLVLKYGNDDLHQMLIKQVDARQKLRKKLPEWYENLDLVLPFGLALEQASSEATAKLKASLLSGNQLLDLTGGLGVDTYYLSQSFDSATYVERNPDLVALAQNNFSALEAGIEVLEGDGVQKLASSEADVIYVDPYRRNDQHKKLVSLKDYQPDVTQLLQHLVKKGRRTLIKTSPMLDISKAIEELQHVSEVWVISYRNECREVLYLLQPESTKPLIRTFNIGPEGTTGFEFRPAEHQLKLSAPLSYLYEPNSSILKAHGQEAAAKEFDLHKLHPNTNFYTSELFHETYPGRVFEVRDTLKPYHKSLHKRRYNVISRNYPDAAPAAEKRLQLKPSDRDFLIATRCSERGLIFISAYLLSRGY